MYESNKNQDDGPLPVPHVFISTSPELDTLKQGAGRKHGRDYANSQLMTGLKWYQLSVTIPKDGPEDDDE